MVRFKETGGGQRRLRSEAEARPKITTPGSKDHRGWALWWSDACVKAIAAYVEKGNPLDLDHAHRCARFTWWHAARAKRYYYWDVMRREGSI